MAATTQGAQRTVLYTIGTVATLATIRDIANGDGPKFRVAFGAAILGAGLGALAEGSPGLAQGFALLLLVSTLVTIGAEVMHDITGGLNPPTTAGSTK